MKIISTKRYNELVDKEHKYNRFTGQEFTIYISGRTLYSRLMGLTKEELVKMLLDMNAQYKDLLKKKGK